MRSLQPKIALVIPWYGLETAGGAEVHGRRLAESLHQAGVPVEVLTSTGKDFFSRKLGDHYREGLDEVNGVPVRRFHLRQDQGESFFQARPHLLEGLTRPVQNHHPVNELIVEDALFEFIETHEEEYYFVFMPYVWGTSIWGCRLRPERSYLIPCLHDEPWAYAAPYRPAFNAVRGLLFNCEPEMELGEQFYGYDRRKAAAIGEGIDMDWSGNARRFRHKFALYDPFLFFAGRRDQGKRAFTLIAYFCEYKKRRPSRLKLAMAGKNPIPIPAGFESEIVDLGFIEEQDKIDAFAAATVFCQPSAVESFSIVLMEAWLQGTPALVNAECAVTAHHCRQSGGGLYFQDYFSFEACLDYFLTRPALRRRMGALGRDYVRQNYRWEDVVERFVEQVYGPEAASR